jgi:hypothetical protein
MTIFPGNGHYLTRGARHKIAAFVLYLEPPSTGRKGKPDNPMVTQTVIERNRYAVGCRHFLILSV